MQDDRKKTIVLIALFVVMLGVGAFQMMPKAPPAAPPKKAVTAPILAAAKPATTATDPAADAMVTEPPLAERDPFEAPPEADTSAKPAVKSTSAPIVASNGPSAPIKQISGNLGATPLPISMLKDGPSGLSGAPAPAAGVKPAEPTFALQVVGLMSGHHPLAIFADAAGNQRLIRAGAAIDPDSKLISVDRVSATVVFRGKTLRLFLVGDQHAK